MTYRIDLSFADGLPRQREFLDELLPVLVGSGGCCAIWLAGSLARGDADRWSSVDLCLLHDPGLESGFYSVPGLLETAFGQGFVLDEQVVWPGGRGALRGLTLAAVEAGWGGVLFSVAWDSVLRAESLRRWHGPTRLLYLTDELPGDVAGLLTADFPSLEPPDEDVIAGLLRRFWLSLARLPKILQREEVLAADAVMTELRLLLVDMVVALNGARRPHSPGRINQYLGPAQREAFEKTLLVPDGGPATWIGQAVALIVLFRWYAPQLVEQHGLDYPASLEHTVLGLLREIDGWPVQITTA